MTFSAFVAPFRSVLRLAGAVAAVVVALNGSAVASCTMPGRQVGPAVLEQMREDPKALLTNYPQGGYGLQSVVAQMAASGPQTLAAVQATFADASAGQSRSIGRGLADAADECLSQDGSVAQRIKDAAQGGNAAMRRAFLSTLPDDTPPPPRSAHALPCRRRACCRTRWRRAEGTHRYCPIRSDRSAHGIDLAPRRRLRT